MDVTFYEHALLNHTDNGRDVCRKEKCIKMEINYMQCKHYYLYICVHVANSVEFPPQSIKLIGGSIKTTFQKYCMRIAMGNTEPPKIRQRKAN